MADRISDVAPKTLVIELGNGDRVSLAEPSMKDLAEGEQILEEETGKPHPFVLWFATSPSFRVLGTAMWIAARKAGFSGTRDEFMDRLTLDDCYRNLKAVADFFTPPAGGGDRGRTSSEPAGSG